jgi:peptidyl-prolyl cis-trans isomerase D
LRNRKKAEIIEKKIGAATTLEAIATALGGRAIETVDSLRFAGGASSAISAEPKVMGAAFNPANKGKISSAIEGSSGVFVIRVDNVTTTPLTNANVAEQRKQQVQLQQQMQMQQGTNALINALMEAGTIKDNRSKFY